MKQEHNVMPFTSRFNYQVEEVSVEEFMAVIDNIQQQSTDRSYLCALKAKINQSKGFS